MHKLYIAIDNGTTGSIGWAGDTYGFVETPIWKELSYTKEKRMVSRIDRKALAEIITQAMGSLQPCDVLVYLERPRVNPQQFRTTLSAMRSLEATLCVVEDLQLPHAYCDSRDWQKLMLPSGIKGSPQLKKASMDIGLRLFPQFSDTIKKHKDTDGLLIAEWARRSQL